ncbi:MAG: amidohydrolase family protein [Anaerolineaceae bacterium]|jgi:predicted TIM-barrel fold metal-dependent hydrolase
MRIDSHLHVWSFNAVEYYYYKPLIEYLELLNIDKCSLIAINEEENTQVKELVSKFPSKFFGLAYVNLLTLDWSLDQLRMGVKEGYFKGVKILSYMGCFGITDPKCMKIYDVCNELEVPVLFHVGWHNSGSVVPTEVAEGSNACCYKNVGLPVELGTVMEAYPNMKAVFAHMGGNYYFECLGIAQRFPNVYLDTAWLEHYAVEQYPGVSISTWIEHACKYLGSDRILYGGEYTLPVDIQSSKITENDKRLIMGENAASLYKV